jgi:hypothetical protein
MSHSLLYMSISPVIKCICSYCDDIFVMTLCCLLCLVVTNVLEEYLNCVEYSALRMEVA